MVEDLTYLMVIPPCVSRTLGAELVCQIGIAANKEGVSRAYVAKALETFLVDS